jgi:hypothetical protein
MQRIEAGKAGADYHRIDGLVHDCDGMRHIHSAAAVVSLAGTAP